MKLCATIDLPTTEIELLSRKSIMIIKTEF